MLVASAPRGEADPSRPRPKRPAVLITTAATGAGVPELLAALDRHRAGGRAMESSAARLGRGAGLGDRRRPPARSAPRSWPRGHDGFRSGGGRGTPHGPIFGRGSAAGPRRRGVMGQGPGSRVPAYHRRHGESDPARLRGRRRADGPRHRPGPCRDRAPGRALRTGPGSGEAGASGSPATWTVPSPRAASTPRTATRRSPGSATDDQAAFADADLVIEAVFEDLDGQDGALARARSARAGRRDLRLEHQLDLDRPAGRGGLAGAPPSGSSGCTSSARCRSCR